VQRRSSHRTPLVALALFALALAPASIASAGEVKAPSFSVKGVDGHTVKSSDFRNHPMVIDFWATWCAPCRASMPHLSDLQQRYAKDGLTIIGMSVDETGPKPVDRFARGLGVKFTIAMANDEILDAFGPIRSIPTTFFINRKGEIVRRVVGFVDSETLDGYVQEILQ
jgi:cytochrome c biogenesis protein CcmG/thiol:disulfide interchange protein DsbE